MQNGNNDLMIYHVLCFNLCFYHWLGSTRKKHSNKYSYIMLINVWIKKENNANYVHNICHILPSYFVLYIQFLHVKFWNHFKKKSMVWLCPTLNGIIMGIQWFFWRNIYICIQNYHFMKLNKICFNTYTLFGKTLIS